MLLDTAFQPGHSVTISLRSDPAITFSKTGTEKSHK